MLSLPLCSCCRRLDQARTRCSVVIFVRGEGQTRARDPSGTLPGDVTTVGQPIFAGSPTTLKPRTGMRASA